MESHYCDYIVITYIVGVGSRCGLLENKTMTGVAPDIGGCGHRRGGSLRVGPVEGRRCSAGLGLFQK